MVISSDVSIRTGEFLMIFRISLISLLLFAMFEGNPTLGQSQAEKVAILLDKLENGSNYKIQIAAAQALGKLGDPSAIAPMKKAFAKEENELVRIAIVNGMTFFRNVDVAVFLVGRGRETLNAMMKKAIEMEIVRLRDLFAVNDWIRSLAGEQNASLRGTIAWILGLIGNDDAGSHLLENLEDSNNTVRKQVLEALGRLRFRDAVTRMEKLFIKTTDSNLRAVISDNLALIKTSPKNPVEKFEIENDLIGAFTYTIFRNSQSGNFSDRLNMALSALSGLDKTGDNVSVKTEKADHRMAKVAGMDIRVLDDNDTTTIRTVSAVEFRPFLRETINKLADDCRMNNPQKLDIFGKIAFHFSLSADGRAKSVDIKGDAFNKVGSFKSCLDNAIGKTLFYMLPPQLGTIDYDLNIAKPKKTSTVSFN